MALVDSKGKPLSYKATAAPKVVSPKVGDAFGQWAGHDSAYIQLPGGAAMQFDLSRLTMSDYRTMRNHYQVGASLNVLTFVMHQIEWSVESDNKEAQDMIESDLRANWTPLIRGLAQAFWAGFSPIAVNYKNSKDGYVRIDRFKDLVPEECHVKWDKLDGWAPPGKPKPKLYKFGGMMQNNLEIPVENSLWYPLLMENGDHYGRKLLKPAFAPWFFSQLIHLFSNRYFERFGEPTPVGRARFDDEVDMGDGTYVSGKKAMEAVVNTIRNRAAVVLPSDRDPVTKEYDYSIEYLESQMRGADFERYLSRLDEEMSLALFTPVLLFRTADVGSYNLGQAHLSIFHQILNAISGDIQYYIQNYLVDRLRVINFGEDCPEVKWCFRPKGKEEVPLYRELMQSLVQSGRAGPDLEELSVAVGLTFNEYEQIVKPPPDPTMPVDPAAPAAPAAGNAPPDPKAPAPPPPKKSKNSAAATVVLDEATTRAMRERGKGKPGMVLGFRNRFEAELNANGWEEHEAADAARTVYSNLNGWLADIEGVDMSAEHFRSAIKQVTAETLERALV